MESSRFPSLLCFIMFQYSSFKVPMKGSLFVPWKMYLFLRYGELVTHTARNTSVRSHFYFVLFYNGQNAHCFSFISLLYRNEKVFSAISSFKFCSDFRGIELNRLMTRWFVYPFTFNDATDKHKETVKKRRPGDLCERVRIQAKTVDYK